VELEDTRESEVDGSITNNLVAREFCAKNGATCDWRAGGVVLIQMNFFTIFTICFMFPGNDLHWRFYYVDRQLKSIFTGGFITSTASENRFSLAVFSYPPVKMMIFTHP
jgi:hypothetical protein